MPLRRQEKQIIIYDDDMVLACEICGVSITGGNAVSIFVEIPMPGVPLTAGQRCTVVQHFYCSYEHAVVGAIVCLLHHIDEDTVHDTQKPAVVVDYGFDLADLKTKVKKHTKEKK